LSEESEDEVEDEDEEEIEEQEVEAEIYVEDPLFEGGSYLYVCSECGSELTEIPYYNRFYCESCGLHY
jgi:hypothetical protein